MKKIEAVIRKSKYSELKKALHNIEVTFFTYWDVTGVGNEQVGHVYRGVTYNTSDIQRRYISIICEDEIVNSIIETVLNIASSGEVGDGKIFISEIVETYRIRTKEKGKDALK